MTYSSICLSRGSGNCSLKCEDPQTISRCVKLLFIAKDVERVGDHAANIAEMGVFMVRGEDIRHETGSDS